MKVETYAQPEKKCLYTHIVSTIQDRDIRKSDLEKNTLMSYSSISRTLKEERDFTKLEYAEILNYLYSPEEALRIVEAYSPNDNALIKLVSDVGSEEVFSPTQEKFFTENSSFSVANLIELGYFETKDQVKELYGLAGISILLKMEKEKLVSISPSGNIKSKFNRAKPSFDTVRKQIALSTLSHKDENCGKMKNFLYFGTKLVSKETRTFIQVLIRQVKEIISSILHENDIESSKIDALTKHLKDFTYQKSQKKTEPIFCSIVLDDFKPTQKEKEVLQ